MLLLCTSTALAGDEEEIGIGIAVVTLGAADISFSIRAAVLAAEGGDAQFPHSLAQTLVSVPQAIGFNGALAALMHDNDAPEAFIALHVPASMTTALAVHGLWSLARPDEDQRFLFLASTAIGVNTMWTSFVIGTATSGRNRFGNDYAIPGIYEVLTTAPGVAIGIHQALETDRFKEGWISISAWSGLLALHGGLFASGVFGGDDYDDDYASAGPIQRLGIAPTSLGAPVEGAPETPGLVVSGAF
jgi:hypothetical protein